MGRNAKRKTEDTSPGTKFMSLFKLFNQEVNLLEAEKSTGPIGHIIKELKAIGLKKRSSDDRRRELELLKDLKEFIRDGANRLPGSYREGYSEILLRNIDSIQEWSPGTLETLAAAVYDHGNQNEQYLKQLRGFLALTSNVYRSFMEPKRLTTIDFPQPISRLPALAMFAPTPTLPPRQTQDSEQRQGQDTLPPKEAEQDSEQHERQDNSASQQVTQDMQRQENVAFLPFTLPVDEVHRLCGAEVAVVRIPSAYRRHPVLSWGTIAHEVGGHDVLHAYPGLLQELRRGVRELFYKGTDPDKPKLDSKKQFLGLLWQYWTEETAADVYAVMNLGPRYGIALLTYFASLFEQIRKYYKEANEGDGLPAIPISNIYDPKRNIWVVDYHPPTVLALHAIIGAIQTLPISNKKTYSNELEKAIEFCLKNGNSELVKKYMGDPIINIKKYETDTVKVIGYIQIKPGNWIWMGPALPAWGYPDNSYPIALKNMQGHAQRVGKFIASATLAALGGHTIQDFETWDEVDEARAQKIVGSILNKGADLELSVMGDDAQLFAGAISALAGSPNRDSYEIVNENLCNALMRSFENDDVWGNPVWHPIAGLSML